MVESADNGNLVAWKEGSFNLSVELPFDGGRYGIKNPLHSVAVGNYLQQNWMMKLTFWCHGVINLLDSAMDMQIEDSNQFSEAVIWNQKHDQDVYEHVLEPADYVLHCWEDSQ